MIRATVTRKYLAIAVLVIAQLGITLHGADHGFGRHAHDGSACVLGTSYEGDALAPPPAESLCVSDPSSAVTPAAVNEASQSAAGKLLPPATGPPVAT